MPRYEVKYNPYRRSGGARGYGHTRRIRPSFYRNRLTFKSKRRRFKRGKGRGRRGRKPFKAYNLPGIISNRSYAVKFKYFECIELSYDTGIGPTPFYFYANCAQKPNVANLPGSHQPLLWDRVVGPSLTPNYGQARVLSSFITARPCWTAGVIQNAALGDYTLELNDTNTVPYPATHAQMMEWPKQLIKKARAGDAAISRGRRDFISKLRAGYKSGMIKRRVSVADQRFTPTDNVASGTVPNEPCFYRLMWFPDNDANATVKLEVCIYYTVLFTEPLASLDQS